VYRGSGRKLSPQQLETAYRRLAEQERREDAQAEVDKMEADLAEQLNSWRDMPNLPSKEDYQASLNIQPFAYDAQEPPPPNYQSELITLESTICTALEKEVAPVSKTIPTIIVIFSFLAGIALAIFSSKIDGAEITGSATLVAASIISLGGAGVGVTVYAIKKRSRQRRLDMEASKRAVERWPGKEQQLRSSHEASIREYNKTKAEAERSWLDQERERVAWASKLLAGDEATIEEAVSQTLADLDFPFETQAEFAIADAHSGYLHVDLPEIEDIVPGTRHCVLRNGRLKEIKHNEIEHNTEYVNVACGIGIMMAAASFAAAPTLQTIGIAAYTQRQQKSKNKGQVDDDYVYFVSIPRTAFTDFDAKSVNPTNFFMVTLSACMEQQANHRLKKLPSKAFPDWVREFCL
jgi:hypothetical protein